MNEIISHRQAASILIVFIFGSTLIIGVSSEAGQDSWLSQLLAAVISIPLLMIYARLIHIMPGMNLYDIFIKLFGKVWGKVLTIVMVWYALHLGGLVLTNFYSFLKIVIMSETPQLPIMIVFIFVVTYLVKSGIETLGKWALIVMPIIISIVFLTTVLSIKQMDLTNILPVFGHSAGSIIACAYKSLTFPYGETVIFLCAADAVNKGDSPYKIYMNAVLISTAVMLVVILRNIELIGPTLIQAEYFPSYNVVRIVRVGNFLQRIEGSISMNFIMAGIVKTTLCVLAAAKGTATVFNISKYRQIVFPVSLLAMTLSAIVYTNAMEMFNFIKYYQYYAIPFQFVIPICVWITAEYKTIIWRRANQNVNSIDD